jgi:predicted NBD/HSP70 family sugar kinase
VCPRKEIDVTDGSQVLAFDIGGSHATVGMVNRETLAIRCKNSRAIDSHGTADSILADICLLGEGALAQARLSGTSPAGLAFAVPGPFDYERGISLLRHKFASLYEMNLRRVFEQRFGIAGENIVFLNDARAFLLGEWHAGAAKGVGRSIGLTLGTGVGSAFAIDGAIVGSGPGVPPGGEIYGLPWEGRTVEDTLSTRAIQERYWQLAGEVKSVHDICTAAPHDCNAALVMSEFGRHLGAVVREICMPFRPEAIVLGGAISRSAALFVPSAGDSLGDDSGHLLQVSTLFEDALLVGAAMWCPEAGSSASISRGTTLIRCGM